MFRIIDRHPFIFGFVAGFIGVGVVGRNLKRILKGKITIIQIDIPKDLTFGDEPCGEAKPKVPEEN